MDPVHKQEFRIRDLPTRTVTLFPTRAHVVRDIEGVVLKPGRNQISVVGLSPTVDANSIQVEGRGAAGVVVSDLAVELLPNAEVFEEVYPDEVAGDGSDASDASDDEESESDDDDDDDDDGLGDDVPAADDTPAQAALRAQLRAVRDELAVLRERLAAGREGMRSAVSQLALLDAYGKTVVGDEGRPKNAADGGKDVGTPPIDALLETYRAERARAFADHQAAVAGQRPLVAASAEQQRREAALERALRRATRQARRARRRARARRWRQTLAAARRALAARQARQRARAARVACWPRVVYTVRVTLEATAPDAEDEGTGGDTSITLAYRTAAASWSPTYDLQLSTATASGVLAFDALLHNHTAETWTRCAVVLSTSATALAGLDDTAVPALVPWRVKLGGSDGAAKDDDSILRSREETAHMARWRARAAAAASTTGGVDHGTARADLFGLDELPRRRPPVAAPGPRGIAYRKTAPPPTLRQQAAAEAERAAGRVAAAVAAAAATNEKEDEKEEDEDDNDDLGELADDDPDRRLSFGRPAAAVAVTPGPAAMTATYALAGRQTLAPTPPDDQNKASSKQRVARVAFAGVQFRHTVVAKYKPAAFLRATLTNGSRWPLPRGPVGLALDGAFLGRATLPRCGPAGDAVTLGLGVAPGLRVAYAGPAVRRTTGGLFGKEARTAYTRVVWVAAGGASSSSSGGASSSPPSSSLSPPLLLLVHDQIPLSQDEKLRVDILRPPGLAVDGPPVPAGVGFVAGRASVLPAGDGGGDAGDTEEADPVTDTTSSTTAAADWGSARASLRAHGEVVWEVALQPGRAVRLDLAYEVSLPAGEGVVQC